MRALRLKVPPVAVTLVAGLAMWGLSITIPVAAFTLPGAPVIAVAIASAGGVIAISGVLAFRRHSTTTNPMKPDAAESIVTDGIYRFTRNPMYLGLALALLAWSIFLANLAALSVPLLFVAYMNQFQVKPEEQALLNKFGRSYADYLTEVRRWL